MYTSTVALLFVEILLLKHFPCSLWLLSFPFTLNGSGSTDVLLQFHSPRMSNLESLIKKQTFSHAPLVFSPLNPATTNNWNLPDARTRKNMRRFLWKLIQFYTCIFVSINLQFTEQTRVYIKVFDLMQCYKCAHQIINPTKNQEYRTSMGLGIQEQRLLLGDNFPWVSYISTHLLIRSIESLCSRQSSSQVFFDNFGTCRYTLPPRQRADLFNI